MTSLRIHLLTWLLPLFLLTAGGAMLVSYRQYESSINAFMDGQMYNLMLTYMHSMSAGSDPPAVRTLDEEHVEEFGTPIVQIWNSSGELLATSWPIPGLALQPASGFRTLRVQKHDWRVYAAQTSPWRLQLVQSGEFRRRVILHSAWKSAAPILLLLPCSAALLWLAIHLGLRPVVRLVRAVSRQDERTLAALELTGVPRELLPLVTAVNGLLSRLGGAFESQQRFVQDAAHELRTPLMALVLQTETLRGQFGAQGAHQVMRLERGIQRLQRLVEQLLQLARHEGTSNKPDTQSVEVLLLLQEVVADLLPLAEKRGIDLGFGPVEALSARADPHALRCIFDNLLDNAIRHSRAGATVDISLCSASGLVQVDVLDSGPGIPTELLGRVFDRFFRPAETAAAGTGLGLAIARAAAHRTGARIELCNRSDRTGLRARVLLPWAAASTA